MAELVIRNITKQIAEDFEDIDAVFINGPRQVGKSTFVEVFAKSYKKVVYLNFDDIMVRSIELSNPGATFDSITEGLVIMDELQFVPNSFLSLKAKIDDVRLKKQKVKFLLTGSADIMLFPKLSEALVGRMYVRTMYPFSVNERVGRSSSFLTKMFKSTPNVFSKFSKFNFSKTVTYATFPKLSLDIKNKTQWCQSYISTLLERDVKNLSDIDKIESLPQLLSILAWRVGALLNEADLAMAIKISQPTLKRYRILLDSVFLTFLLPPWFKNLEKRLVKSPKVYFYDTMLLCHLLGGSPEEIKIRRPDFYGFVLENFVVTELKKQLALMDDGSLYHLRTSDQKEVDFLIEKRDGRLIAIEVKASTTVNIDDFKHLRFLQKSLSEKFVQGIVLYSGDKVVTFGKNLFAVPLTALWEI